MIQIFGGGSYQLRSLSTEKFRSTPHLAKTPAESEKNVLQDLIEALFGAQDRPDCPACARLWRHAIPILPGLFDRKGLGPRYP